MNGRRPRFSVFFFYSFFIKLTVDVVVVGVVIAVMILLFLRRVYANRTPSVMSSYRVQFIFCFASHCSVARFCSRGAEL